MTKRVFDVAASAVGLIILSPVMAVIAILVKRDSDGPVLFRQTRVGRGGQSFTLLKFRSMSAANEPSGPLVTVAGDSRITKVGARLRASKLDELPQLVNVLRGEMSIVGPRPEVAEYVDLWDEGDRRIILSVRPGITDPATLQLRHEEELLLGQDDPESYYRQDLLPKKTAIYHDYVLSRSLANDIAVIFRTLYRIILG